MDQNLGENKHDFYFKNDGEAESAGLVAPKSLLDHSKVMLNQ